MLLAVEPKLALRPVAFGGRTLETFSFHDGPFVRAATNLAALIMSTDLKDKQLAFAASVASVSDNESPGRGWCGVCDIDGYADGQFARREQRLQHARSRSFHQRDHACSGQH